MCFLHSLKLSIELRAHWPEILITAPEHDYARAIRAVPALEASMVERIMLLNLLQKHLKSQT